MVGGGDASLLNYLTTTRESPFPRVAQFDTTENKVPPPVSLSNGFLFRGSLQITGLKFLDDGASFSLESRQFVRARVRVHRGPLPAA